MKYGYWNRLKLFAIKTLLTGAVIFAFWLVAAIVQGAVSLVAGTLLGLALLLGINTLCGILLPAPQPQHVKVKARRVHRGTPRVAAAPRPALRVVRGQRAA